MRFRLFVCAFAMYACVQSAAAQMFTPDLPAHVARIVTAKVNTFLRFVHEETDKLGLQRPLLIDADYQRVPPTDIMRILPLIDTNRGTIVAWGIAYNTHAFMLLTRKQLRYQARMSVCYKQKGHLDKLETAIDTDDLQAMVKCVYHKYADHELADFIELFRESHEPTFTAVGYELGTDEEVRAFLRRTFGDPPLEHWTGR